MIDAGSRVIGHALLISNAQAGGDEAFRGVSTAGPCGSGPDANSCASLGAGSNVDDGNHFFVDTTAINDNTEEDHASSVLVY